MRKTAAEYHADLRAIAREHGGELLSRTYAGDAVKLRFRCADGHRFEAAPMHVKQGKWCRKCGIARRAMAKKAQSVVALRSVVESRGGLILSREYVDSQSKLRYRCAEGHEWEAVPSSVMQGKWCPRCARLYDEQHERRRRTVLRRLQREARKRGGAMLSPTFISSKTRHRFRCARGHTWEAKAESIDAGVWCLACKEEDLLAGLRSVAESRGGSLLSTSAERMGKSRLLWRCAAGHRWEATAVSVTQGSWCPMCRGLRPGSLERMRQVARERGGECLSTAYGTANEKLRWRCALGHEWESIAASVIQGTWCPVCSLFGRNHSRLDIETLRWVAAERGGECLSKTYTRSRDRMRWRCARGHEWTALVQNIRSGHWCPRCSRTVRGTLEAMQGLARSHGGRCLTRRWNNHREPLAFQCEKGHRFKRNANVIMSGVWCPHCEA